MVINQNYGQYTAVDHNTWSILYKRQAEAVKLYAYQHFFKGVQQLGFAPDRIPDFEEVNRKLMPITGWNIYPVPGLIDNKFFFEQMHDKKFGATAWIRKPEQIDYLEEPDLFHDVFGHVPLLTDKHIAAYLFGLAKIANRFIDDEAIVEAIARVYWYTIEFGLVRENGVLKIYGAGILSSIAETLYCLSDKPAHVDFDMITIINTPYIKDNFQEQYFVLNSMADLSAALPVLEAHFEKQVA